MFLQVVLLIFIKIILQIFMLQVLQDHKEVKVFQVPQVLLALQVLLVLLDLQVRLVLLVQREVGERIRCQAGSSAYSALSVRMQLLADCRTVCPVPPRCFQPPPKVHSEVIVLDPLPAPRQLDPQLARTVEHLLKRCFASRRKMLRNSLAGLLGSDALEALALEVGITLQQRPQEVAPLQWVALAAGLNQPTPARP